MRRHRHRNGLLPLCATALILTGVLGVHHEAAGLDPGLDETTISVGARHAEQEAHFEEATLKELGRCSTCLLRSRSGAVEMRLLGEGPPTPPDAAAAVAESGAVRCGARLHAPSRAPPVS